MIKLHGFGGPSRFWDYGLESFTLMAGLAAVTIRIQLFASIAVLTMPPPIAARMAVTIDSIAPDEMAAIPGLAGVMLDLRRFRDRHGAVWHPHPAADAQPPAVLNKTTARPPRVKAELAPRSQKKGGMGSGEGSSSPFPSSFFF